MKVWEWFCKLGVNNIQGGFRPWQIKRGNVRATTNLKQSGVDTVCSRYCGQDACRCGGSMRGIHCIWSHYRAE